MPDKRSHRMLRTIVWFSRGIGWIVIALALLNILQIGALTRLAAGFRLFSSLGLGLLGIAWVVGVELFLRFFDRYLARN